MEPYLQQYCQRHIQEYISWNRNQHKPGKSTTGMMLLSLLRVQDNNILPKWYEETTGLCFDCPEDDDLHIPSQPTCSHFSLWVEVQAKHCCAYANRVPCLFCLRAPPFTVQIKLLHPCVSFLGTSYKNALQQVLWKLWFIYYLSVFWKVLAQKLCLLNLMKQKVLAKQTDSFEIKFYKNAILKHICNSTFAALQVIYLVLLTF